jgi:C-methyltransferase C-terminal domain/Putative zinc binding domain
MVTGASVEAATAVRLVCRGCGNLETRMIVDLGRQPASDDFPLIGAPGPDATWPLQLWFCSGCALVQLGPVEALLEEPVRAVESQTSLQHAAASASALLTDYPQLAGRTVREFASHHGGSWMETLKGFGCLPAEDGQKALLVIDVHGLAHEQDVRASLLERAASLARGGLMVMEFHHLLPLVEQGQFDTVRHGHWSYLSLTAIHNLAAEYGLMVIQAVPEEVFGGSLRVVLAHQDSPQLIDLSVPRLLAAERAAGLDDGSGLETLGARARESARALRTFLTEQRRSGRKVLAYGAPSKAAILLGLSGIDADLLTFTVDAAPLKQGLAIPGGRVPIRPVEHLIAARPDVVLILTWDIADEVVERLESDGGWGADYILPLPVPHTFVPLTTGV